MANALYGLGRQGFLDGTIDWDTDNIKVALVDITDGYSVDIDVDQWMNHDTIGSALKIAISANLTIGGSDTTLGVADATDETFSSVSGNACGAIVIFKDGGGGGVTQSGTDDLLIAYIHEATGLPVTPNGGDIEIQWDSGGDKIFKL